MGASEQEIEQWLKSALPVYRFMNLSVISVSDGAYRCLVPLGANTGNHINTVHAAFQWASAEILGGLVVLTNRADPKHVPVVNSLDIKFIRPALSDITSEALFSQQDVELMNSTLADSGRYDFNLSSTIRNADGEIVAEASGCYAVRHMDVL